MKGQFTYYCTHFYELLQLLDQQEARFNRLLQKALPYTGQTNIAELDAILDCNLKVQEARATAGETRAKLLKTESVILKILDYFEIAPNTTLTCEIPGEVVLLFYKKENDRLYCFKTKDLAPIVDDPNIITIKTNHSRYRADEDED